MGAIVKQTMQAGASVHMGEVVTQRRLAACTSLVEWAAGFIYHGMPDAELRNLDDVFRACLALVVGDETAHAQPFTVGAVLASLDANQAAELRTYVDDTVNLRRPLSYTDDGRPSLAAPAA